MLFSSISAGQLTERAAAEPETDSRVYGLNRSEDMHIYPHRVKPTSQLTVSFTTTFSFSRTLARLFSVALIWTKFSSVWLPVDTIAEISISVFAIASLDGSDYSEKI